MQKTVLATGNAGKAAELQRLLGERFELVLQSDLGVKAPPEVGLSYIENALIKARAAAAQTGLPSIADDSGLSVNALDGRPGIYSARFAGEQASDADNNALLLDNLKSVGERAAAFHCALVYLRYPEDPLPIICQGRWPGYILSRPQGEDGFGYDPLFFVPSHQCSAAQLDPTEKNRVSHRGQAMQQLVDYLLGS